MKTRGWFTKTVLALAIASFSAPEVEAMQIYAPGGAVNADDGLLIQVRGGGRGGGGGGGHRHGGGGHRGGGGMHRGGGGMHHGGAGGMHRPAGRTGGALARAAHTDQAAQTAQPTGPATATSIAT